MEEQPDPTQDIMTALGRMAAALQRGGDALIKRLEARQRDIERLMERVQALEQKMGHDAPKDE